MQYRSDRKGTKLSILGYGCLRFTKENGKIDIDKTEKEIMEAIRSGVNYFDTAYVYGGSEAVLGEILERNGAGSGLYCDQVASLPDQVQGWSGKVLSGTVEETADRSCGLLSDAYAQ